jgi:hypothetical protein
MGLFKKRPDPISDRARALKCEIAALEAQIRELHAKAKTEPRLRSTVVPHSNGHDLGDVSETPKSSDPVFETIGRRNLESPIETLDTPELYNDLGVRKFDLTATWKRMQSHFRGPTANNPKLVSYLAAGSIRGLRPLRYEKRIARRRVMALFVILFLLVWGVAAAFVRHNG